MTQPSYICPNCKQNDAINIEADSFYVPITPDGIIDEKTLLERIAIHGLPQLNFDGSSTAHCRRCDFEEDLAHFDKMNQEDQ